MMNSNLSFSSLILHAALSVQPHIYRQQERDYNEYMHLHLNTLPAKESRMNIVREGMSARWKRVNGRLVSAWAE